MISGANHFVAPKKRPKVALKEKAYVAPNMAAKKEVLAVSGNVDHADKKASSPAAQKKIITTRKRKVMNEKPLREDNRLSQRHKGLEGSEGMSILQESLLSLSNLQMQNAKLHEEYLKGQRSAQDMFGRLLERQLDYMAGVSPESRGGYLADSQEAKAAYEPAAPAAAAAPAPVLSAPAAPAAAAAPAPAPVFSAPAAPAPAPVASTLAAPEKVLSSAAAPAGSVLDILVGIIAEKTGFPVEMIEPEMSLEGDLGIDSIKRVEIMASFQDVHPQAADVPPEELSVLATVAEIVAKFDDSRGAQTQPEAAAKAAVTAPAAAAPQPAASAEKVYEIVAEKTGYPPEILTGDMNLEADLGIDSIKRVEILAALTEVYPHLENGAFSSESAGQIQTLDDLVTPIVSESLNGSAPVNGAARSGAVSSPLDMREVLISVVAEKTGFPEDMISLDMALEGDLGIDSIKRVEILAALRDKEPEVDSAPQEALSQAPTLEEILSILKKSSAPTLKAGRSLS